MIDHHRQPPTHPSKTKTLKRIQNQTKMKHKQNLPLSKLENTYWQPQTCWWQGANKDNIMQN